MYEFKWVISPNAYTKKHRKKQRIMIQYARKRH